MLSRRRQRQSNVHFSLPEWDLRYPLPEEPEEYPEPLYGAYGIADVPHLKEFLNADAVPFIALRLPDNARPFAWFNGTKPARNVYNCARKFMGTTPFDLVDEDVETLLPPSDKPLLSFLQPINHGQHRSRYRFQVIVRPRGDFYMPNREFRGTTSNYAVPSSAFPQTPRPPPRKNAWGAVKL
jgi:hypothetical protein